MNNNQRHDFNGSCVETQRSAERCLLVSFVKRKQAAGIRLLQQPATVGRALLDEKGDIDISARSHAECRKGGRTF